MILITGGAGFIGCNLVRFLLENMPNEKVRVFDKLTYAGSVENLAYSWNRATGYNLGRIEFVRGDVCDKAAVQQAVAGVDTVIHLAAESSVDRSLTNVEETWRTNYFGTHTVLEAAWCSHADPPRFIHVSTDEVYGPTKDRNFHETDFLNANPRNPYAVSKLLGDMVAMQYVPVIITRPANNYGPYQYPDKLIPLLTYRALCNEPLPVYGDGKQRRDWLHVHDHCRAILALVTSKGPLYKVYNIPGGNEHENIEVVRIILDELGKPESLIEYVADRPGHDIRYGITGCRIASLGWEPEIDWEEGLRETVRWYAEHQSWLARRMASIEPKSQIGGGEE